MNDDVTQASASTRSSETIGPYRLLQRIGEGGMGEVWLAEQTRPLHRQVALKIIKAGMDSAQVVARFEAERQALALMSHPAIAQVFDAGATPQERPFFAMEYVPGEPITSYCDRHRLTTRQRIDLVLEICEGVQHAHQKGIIHRDLKPSNILVTVRDDRPVPKIIDFGVAKATTQHLTERTLYTELGVLIGTPEYAATAETRGTDPSRLAGQLRGDFDWITMKALEKDRTRRYGSVSDLAADLRRHLDNLPVIASPPSTVYRVRKFVRRHRVGVGAV